MSFSYWKLFLYFFLSCNTAPFLQQIFHLNQVLKEWLIAFVWLTLYSIAKVLEKGRLNSDTQYHNWKLWNLCPKVKCWAKATVKNGSQSITGKEYISVSHFTNFVRTQTIFTLREDISETDEIISSNPSFFFFIKINL